MKQNVSTFLAFLCSSNWNEWYVSKRRSKGPGVDHEFKVRGIANVIFRSTCYVQRFNTRTINDERKAKLQIFDKIYYDYQLSKARLSLVTKF